MTFDEKQESPELVTTSIRPNATSHGEKRRAPVLAFVAVLTLVALSGAIFGVLRPHLGAIAGHPSQATRIPQSTQVPQATATPANNPANGGFVFASSFVTPDDIWAVGNMLDSQNHTSSALIVHYTNGHWNTVSSGAFPNVNLQSVSMISANEGWAVGIEEDFSNPSQYMAAFLHYLNGQWSKATAPALPSDLTNLNAVQMFSSTTGIAAAYEASGNILILRYVQGTWTVTNPQIDNQSGLDTTVPADVSALGVNDIWVRGDHLVKHFDGTQWTTVYPISGTSENIEAINVVSDRDIWLQINSSNAQSIYFEHYNGTTWSRVDAPATLPVYTQPYGFVGQGWGIVLGSGQSPSLPGYLLHFTGGQCKVTQIPSLADRIVSVLTVSPDEAWAVSYVVGEASSPNTLAGILQRLHYVNGTWSVA